MSNRLSISRWPKRFVLVLLAGIFIWSGLSKMINPEAFALAVYRYHLLPGSLVNGVSLWISALEVLCAVIILGVPRWRNAALWILLFLLVIFTLAVSMSLLLGREMTCGCFSLSPIAAPMGWGGLGKNAGLILLVMFCMDKHKKIPPGVAGRDRVNGSNT